MTTDKCPHLNCLVYHPDGVCRCDMKPYCPECRKSNQDQKDMVKSVEWEKEFDEKFVYDDTIGRNWKPTYVLSPETTDEIKSFIRTLLADTRKEVVEDIRKGISELEPNLQGHMVYTAIDRIKELLK